MWTEMSAWKKVGEVANRVEQWAQTDPGWLDHADRSWLSRLRPAEYIQHLARVEILFFLSFFWSAYRFGWARLGQGRWALAERRCARVSWALRSLRNR